MALSFYIQPPLLFCHLIKDSTRKEKQMNILFLNQEEPVMGTVTVQDLHHVKIEGVLQNLSGFHLVTNDGQVYGKYDYIV